MNAELVRLLTKLPLLGSALRRGRARGAPGEVPLREIGWDEFETLVVEGFLRRGYHLAGPSRSAAVGGDLLLRRERETYLVHCKAWRSAKVGVSTMQTLHAAMRARGVDGGFVLSFGRVGREAARFAALERIQVLAGPALEALIEPVRRDRLRAADAPLHAQTPPVQRAVPPSPSCPLCGKPMRLRKARRGRSAGRGFWACIGHPDCKGLRALVT